MKEIDYKKFLKDKWVKFLIMFLSPFPTIFFGKYLYRDRDIIFYGLWFLIIGIGIIGLIQGMLIIHSALTDKKYQ